MCPSAQLFAYFSDVVPSLPITTSSADIPTSEASVIDASIPTRTTSKMPVSPRKTHARLRPQCIHNDSVNQLTTLMPSFTLPNTDAKLTEDILHRVTNFATPPAFIHPCQQYVYFNGENIDRFSYRYGFVRGLFADTYFTVANYNIRFCCHAYVLAQTPFLLDQMLKSSTRGEISLDIVDSNITYESICFVIGHLYGIEGDVLLTLHHAPGVLAFAYMMDVKDICEKACEIIKQKINEENVERFVKFVEGTKYGKYTEEIESAVETYLTVELGGIAFHQPFEIDNQEKGRSIDGDCGAWRNGHMSCWEKNCCVNKTGFKGACNSISSTFTTSGSSITLLGTYTNPRSYIRKIRYIPKPLLSSHPFPSQIFYDGRYQPIRNPLLSPKPSLKQASSAHKKSVQWCSNLHDSVLNNHPPYIDVRYLRTANRVIKPGYEKLLDIYSKLPFNWMKRCVESKNLGIDFPVRDKLAQDVVKKRACEKIGGKRERVEYKFGVGCGSHVEIVQAKSQGRGA
ncbi:4708_t:CDS:1 [Paraglomus occultum]|uniref:4708_t:CDS:1 n=1 Tax=Paraglomus occultum TaxID=144539 RepID=A0A9N8Z238_9GLOM|nr:4708_t:CDS:1 [Paraglomus occultum]